MAAQYTELVQVKVSPPAKSFLEGWANAEGLKVADMIRRLINQEQNRQMKQLPLADASTPESEAETMRRLKAQEFPQIVNLTDLYLGTGPGDEAA